MRNKSSTGIFMFAYNLARSTGLLDSPLFKRVFLSSYFLYKRWYEDPFWQLTRRSPELFANGDVLDIGANIGYTAYVFARAITPPAKVFAFEPDQASFATLTEVIHRKNLAATVEAFQSAVGSEDGSLEFWHNKEHSADHRVVTEQFKAALKTPLGTSLKDSRAPDQTTSVAVTSVDNFVAARNLRNISFIKIDVQGYELAVCEGMRQTLRNFPDVCVALEYAPDAMRELGFEPSALLDFFRAAGYQLYVLTRSATQPAESDNAIDQSAAGAGYVDLLCSKKRLG